MSIVRNRSLNRGITLLEVLAREGPCSLHDLHLKTDLPKSTIRRLLATMTDRRLVRRSLADQRYRSNTFLPHWRSETAIAEDTAMVDIAMPHIMELTARIEWPSDLHLLQDDWMHIVDSTRPLSPFHLYRGKIDRRINQFASAGGVACLSMLSDEEIANRVARLQNDRHWGLSRFGINLDEFMTEVAAARRRGYGTRIRGYLGETILDDSLSAIAVPLCWRGVPRGAATLVWPRIYMKHEEFASKYLDSLLNTAERITEEVLLSETGTTA